MPIKTRTIDEYIHSVYEYLAALNPTATRVIEELVSILTRLGKTVLT